MKLVTAIWNAGYPVHYAREDRILQPGDSARVPEQEAHDSANWSVPDTTTKKSPAAAEAKE